MDANTDLRTEEEASLHGRALSTASYPHDHTSQDAATIHSHEPHNNANADLRREEEASLHGRALSTASYPHDHTSQDAATIHSREPLQNRARHALHTVFVDLPLRPLRWVSMLARELDPTFVFGVLVTYGWSQGFGGAVYRIAGNYFWKDVQRVQPATAQLYDGIIKSVWDWKPVWGLLTDLVPLGGFHRRPYFILSGLLSFLSLLVLIIEVQVRSASAVIILLLYTLGVTIADVTIDAEVAKRSHENPSLATHMQTLCSICAAVCGFIGFSTSGFIVDILGPTDALGLLCISGVLFLVLGLTLNESQILTSYSPHEKVGEKFKNTCTKILKTLTCPQVWQPTLYMFISWATSLSVAEGKFYWLTDQQRGLGFSQEFVGMSYAIGSLGAIFGTIFYQNVLKDWPFRRILFWAQILMVSSGMVDLLLALRWNVKVHIPDAAFVLFDEITLASMGRLKWIPQLVLCAKLCPPGIEGTFFALLMAVDNLGLLTGTWGGALLQHSLGITRDDFSNLWLAMLIRNAMRLLPLCVLFLVPNVDPASLVIPPEVLLGLGGAETQEEDEAMELMEKETEKS